MTNCYEYDNNGNIKSKLTYELGSTTELMNSAAYRYNSKGKLLSYRTERCQYDAIGNPTVYRSKVLNWSRGRQLTSYGNNTFE